MKRLYTLSVAIILLLSIALSLSGCADKATDFPISTVENGYYNYLAGGNMACVDDNLYVNIIGGIIYLGTYKENSTGTTKLFTKEIDADYSVNAPIMYQINNDIYFTDADYSEFRLYDCDKDLLTEETLEIKSVNGVCYMSEDLSVWFSDDEIYHLIVKYKDNKEVKLEKSASSFTVYDDKIYFITDNGALYYNDPSTLKSECEFVSRLNDNGLLPKMLICNGYCYFTDTGTEDAQKGVYRYSFEKDTVELVLDQEVISMNMQGNKVYFATEKGVYVDDSVECTKFTSKKATELYVFDDEWIYLYNQEKGLIHRVSADGTKTQLIG